MKAREIKKTLNEATRTKSFLRSDKYINAQMSKFGLHQIGFQMGPNCNTSCSHCYGDYGPHRKGLLNLKIVKKTLEDAADFPFSGFVLTDGEPLRHENKKVMKVFAEHSDKFPLAILSNGIFARTQQNAIDWMNFLKDNGFDLNKNTNLLRISFGAMYNVNMNNYFRINNAVKKVFPNADVGKHFNYLLVGIEDKDEMNLLGRVMKGLEFSFGKRRRFRFTESKGVLTSVKIYPEKGSPIKINYLSCHPDGRAKNFSIFDKIVPVKDLEVEDLGFSPDLHEDVWISNKGDVTFGISGACVRKGKFYGNVQDKHLLEIVHEINKDSVYQAFKLGGARFLYSLGQQVDPDFKVRGRMRCDICHDFFSDSKMRYAVGKKLDKEGVVQNYKRFINGLDLRKTAYL